MKNFFVPKPCSFETLSQAHSKDYIKNIQNKTLDLLSQKKIGFPLNDGIVPRSFVATGGTVLASKLAINSVQHAIQQEEVIMQVLTKVQVLCF